MSGMLRPCNIALYFWYIIYANLFIGFVLRVGEFFLVNVTAISAKIDRVNLTKSPSRFLVCFYGRDVFNLETFTFMNFNKSRCGEFFLSLGVARKNFPCEKRT